MTKGFLTTHVLDVYSGNPAKDIKVDLYYISNKREKLNSIILKGCLLLIIQNVLFRDHSF